jgi:DNA-nicking Smr family endonuclease
MDDDRELFESAMAGVAPLPGDGDRGPGRVPGKAPRGHLRRPSLQDGGAAPRWSITRFGERVEGRAADSDERALAALGRGEVPVELSLDLHRRTAEDARHEVRRTLAQALEGGLRCVRVIHGRGTHSAGGPTLKEALPGWLAEPPHGRRVQGFVTAPPTLGGTGATLVLLARKRRR